MPDIRIDDDAASWRRADLPWSSDADWGAEKASGGIISMDEPRFKPKATGQERIDRRASGALFLTVYETIENPVIPVTIL
ncbi:MAG: hypothetical protein F4Y38_03790 [Gemmatimonadetes bacterium]|nr:hypothetical protein [Gemmatimonadota bacterium]MYG84678.1 hypothetical protein [Gemmatimonadota bacterium]MYJ88687.1 hypothetical protein [Gemmatimonadota bacterium]